MPLNGAPKKKDLPMVGVDEQITLLTHPEQNPTGYQPFVDADKFPFEPRAVEVTRTNAWWLAEAAWLSYSHSEPDVKAVYTSRTGMSAALLSANGTECTVASNDAFAIVAFRGTQPDQWRDLFSDARWFPKGWDAGHVHGGFAEAFEVIWPKLKDLLDHLAPKCRVWFTGHSLGAALATLAAYRCASTAGVCTFGSPLVGNQSFAGSFNTKLPDRSLRYVNDHDVVTRVPPEEFAFPFGRYAHVDLVRSIGPDGTVSGTAPRRFFQDVIGQPSFMFHLMQNIGTLGFPSLPDSLRDHTPLHYVIHVWNDFASHWQPLP